MVVPGTLPLDATALVERALRHYLAEKRREELDASYAEAARDPAFVAEMRAVSDAFEKTVADGLPESAG